MLALNALLSRADISTAIKYNIFNPPLDVLCLAKITITSFLDIMTWPLSHSCLMHFQACHLSFNTIFDKNQHSLVQMLSRLLDQQILFLNCES